MSTYLLADILGKLEISEAASRRPGAWKEEASNGAMDYMASHPATEERIRMLARARDESITPGSVSTERRQMMKKKSFPLSRVYRLLEPGPVVLVTTSRKGKANVMTMSWYTMMEFVPPLVGCVLSGRNYSFEALTATKECVLNIPSAELAKQVVGVGNCSGKKVDKFGKFGLTPLPAELVAPPLIAECYANFECRVADARFVNKYNFFVLEVVKAWIDPSMKNPRTLHHQGGGVFMVGGDTIKLPSKMK